MKEWAQKNKERCKEAKRVFRLNNREKCIMAVRRCEEANKEKYNAKRKEWYEANKERVGFLQRQRRVYDMALKYLRILLE